MKYLSIILFTLHSAFYFSQKINGFTIISDKNIYKTNSDGFSLTNGDVEEKLNEENIFSFSFIDSVFIHTPINKEGMISQVYKITDVISNHETPGLDQYLIRIESGLSGKYYTYYIEYTSSNILFNQIYDFSDESEDKFSCSGIRFEKLTYTLIRPFLQ